MSPRTLPLVAPLASLAAPFSSAAPLVAARTTLARAGWRVWAVLERIGRQRAAGELARTAALIEHSQPEVARLLRAEAAARRVR
jgi:hypothetical protein